MRKLWVLSLSLLLVLTLGACADEEEQTSLEAIQERGYIILGLDDTFAPMGFRNEDGEITGFDVELAYAVADRLGVELRLQPIEWNSKELELNAKNIDMIWNGLTITDERKEQILFSDPYLNNRQIVMTRGDIPMESLNDLSGLTVGVQLESSGQSALESNAIFSDIDEMVKFDSYLEAILDLNSGRIDAIVIDEVMGRYILSQNTYSLEVSDVSLGDEEYGIGFRLDDASLCDKIDEILSELQGEGVTASISEYWFSEDRFRK